LPDFGTLRSRIALPFSLSQNYDALVGDGEDNVLIAITGTGGSGIAVVDLSSLAEPAPLPYSASSFTGTYRRGSMDKNAAPSHPRSTVLAPRMVPKYKVPHVTNRFLFFKASSAQAHWVVTWMPAVAESEFASRRGDKHNAGTTSKKTLVS
jgi:hypothetical protein